MSCLRFILLFAVLLTSGCQKSKPPSYIRLSGAAPKLSDVPEARALLVSFWASWCAPCREETPGLTRLAQSPPPGLHVVVMSEDEELKPVNAFFGGAPDPSLHLRLDSEQAFAGAFGVSVLPAAILIVDGRLAARFDGPREWDSAGMRTLLERLVSEPSGPGTNAAP